MQALLNAAMRLTLGLWVGGIGMFTFLLTPAIFGHYPRDEAGRIVAVLFPLYFPYLTVLTVLALALFVVLRRGRWRVAQGIALVLLLASVAANGTNQFKIHPESRALKAEIHSGETLAPEHPLRREFARQHGVSMALNLLVLTGGLALLLGGPVWWRNGKGMAMDSDHGHAADKPLQIFVWRHSKRHSSWSMLDEPDICKESYQAAQVAVLAHSKREALALLDGDGKWNVAEMERLAPEIVALRSPRVITSQIDPF